MITKAQLVKELEQAKKLAENNQANFEQAAKENKELRSRLIDLSEEHERMRTALVTVTGINQRTAVEMVDVVVKEHKRLKELYDEVDAELNKATGLNNLLAPVKLKNLIGASKGYKDLLFRMQVVASELGLDFNEAKVGHYQDAILKLKQRLLPGIYKKMAEVLDLDYDTATGSDYIDAINTLKATQSGWKSTRDKLVVVANSLGVFTDESESDYLKAIEKLKQASDKPARNELICKSVAEALQLNYCVASRSDYVEALGNLKKCAKGDKDTATRLSIVANALGLDFSTAKAVDYTMAIEQLKTRPSPRLRGEPERYPGTYREFLEENEKCGQFQPNKHREEEQETYDKYVRLLVGIAELYFKERR